MERKDAKRVVYNDRGCLNMFAVKSAFTDAGGETLTTFDSHGIASVLTEYVLFLFPAAQYCHWKHSARQREREKEREKEEEEKDRRDYNRFNGYPGIVHPNDTFFDSSRCTTTMTMTILRVSVVSSRASERRR